MSTFAPLQFLKSAQNPLVWTAVDNGTDSRTSLIIYNGSAHTLPSDTGLYEVNCIMMHQTEKQLYANIGTPITPSWAAFGPGSAFPQPLVPGTFLFTDGVSVYWATSLVGQVQYNASNLNTYGILNFNDLLVASNDVPNSRINVDLDVVSLASNTTFVSNLESNLSLQNIGGSLNWSQINQSTVLVDLSTQVTGSISIGNLDLIAIANDATFLATLIPNLDENVKVAVDGVTITGDGTTANPLVAAVSSDNFTVKATAADTTPSYLDNKLNIHSTDGSVTVTKTITNPAGNEVVDYDLSVPTNISGIANTRTAISIFQDFCGNQINSGGGGSSITYGGLYPYTTQNSNTQRADENNHPGVVQFVTGGSLDVGFDLSGLDASDLSIEGMFYFDKTIPTNALIVVLQSSFGGTANYFQVYLKTISGETYSVNGSTPASCTYISGWNTFKVLYNTAGTSASFYLNGTLVGSSLPVSQPGAAPTATQGNDCKLDYLSVNATITR
jgi:hypothetical protein